LEDYDMQTRLEISRFPSILLVFVFAVVAALVLGGALGYALKPSSVIAGPGHVTYLPISQLTSSGANDPCVFVDKQKQC
jgi:hypothetical protein